MDLGDCRFAVYQVLGVDGVQDGVLTLPDGRRVPGQMWQGGFYVGRAVRQGVRIAETKAGQIVILRGGWFDDDGRQRTVHDVAGGQYFIKWSDAVMARLRELNQQALPEGTRPAGQIGSQLIW